MMRIFSPAEYCFRVARRISLTTRSDDPLVVSYFCLIFASPWSYDEPQILPCSTRPFCLTSAHGAHAPLKKPTIEDGRRPPPKPRPGVPETPAIKEEHQTRSGESPRADGPSGDRARDHNAGG